MKLGFHPGARDDLLGIFSYLAEHNEVAATEMIGVLEEVCRFLSENPHAGRPRPDLHESLRSFPKGDYLVLYRILGEAVQVVHIAHGRRDLAALVSREGR